MSKRKKSKDEFVNLIRSFWTRKRADRKFTIPTNYLESVADQLWRQNPTKEIVFNTIKDVWVNGAEKGVEWKSNQIRFFKEKQNKAFEVEFNGFKDSVDDLIHEKSNKPK